LPQNIIEDDEIKLDWFFKVSLIHDLVKVSNSDYGVKFVIPKAVATRWEPDI